MGDKVTKGGPFDLPDLSFDDYRNQEVIETDDGVFFDGLDEMFGIEPRTDELKDGDSGHGSR